MIEMRQRLTKQVRIAQYTTCCGHGATEHRFYSTCEISWYWNCCMMVRKNVNLLQPKRKKRPTSNELVSRLFWTGQREMEAPSIGATGHEDNRAGLPLSTISPRFRSPRRPWGLLLGFFRFFPQHFGRHRHDCESITSTPETRTAGHSSISLDTGCSQPRPQAAGVV